MSYTEEFHKEAYFSDLYELSVERAAEKIHEGLWNSDQATKDEIREAMLVDIKKGNLKLVRGNMNIIGKYNNNEPILNASEVANWAEKNGLELESNGAWNSYMLSEAELGSILIDKLSTLRALQHSGKSLEEILNDPATKQENQQDELIRLMVENEQLKTQINHESVEPEQNPKAIASVFKMLSAMAFDGYGYRWKDNKSSVPKEIAATITEILGENIDEGTVRKWLKHSSDHFPPKVVK
jgi:hypothetical protein